MQEICAFRKFLFFLRYDGSRFSSMAKGAASHKGPSVYKLFECCLARLFDEENSKILTTTVSRTDAKVHALRNPILIKTPNERTASLIQSYDSRTKFICDFNDLIEKVGFKDAMELVEINPVEKGFNRNFHISYRRYVYRIRRFHSMDAFLKSRENDKQSLVDLSEFNYSWSHPPSFCVEKADEMCAILRRPELNYASFYNHKSRERLDGKNYKTTTGRRQPKLLRIYRGEPYALPDKDSEYFNIEIVAHSFLRQQIRRMVALICRAAYNIDYAKYTAEFLLRDPDPTKFHQAGLKPAPPNGLFLVDVVYDPRMFLSPVPYYSNPWDDEDMNEDIKLNNEGEEEEDLDDYDEIKEERKLRVLVN